MIDHRTYISIEFWQIVSFLLAFLGFCWGFGKILLAQYEKRIAEIQKQGSDLEKAVNHLNATLPLNYVLRDDYIRGQAVLEAKMDSIQKTVTDLYKMESQKQ